MHRFSTRLYFGVVVFLIFLIQGIWGLSHYGINWDEPVHYIRGQAYLRFLLRGKTDYNDLPKLKSHYPKYLGNDLPSEVILEDDKIFRRSIYQYDGGVRGTFFWFLENDSGHPPLNGILASFFNYVFYQKLGIMGDIESYHLFVILISSLLVVSIFLFTSYVYGLFAGVVATLSLVLYPLFFSESHFSIKDPVEMVFYTFSIIAFYFGITKTSWTWLLFTGISAGFALGTKLNIIFVVFAVIPWIVAYKWKDISCFKWPFSRSITLSVLTVPIIAFAILFSTWPYLWRDPLSHFSSFLSYYKTISTTSYQVDSNVILFGLNTYAIQWILYTTPLVTLFFTLFGIVYTFTKRLKEKEKTSLLVLLWFIVPIARVTMPNAGIYGGVRQIMEYIPAIAILSGIGATYMVAWLHGYMVKLFKVSNHVAIQLLQLLVIFSFIPITIKLVSIHPNENVYFNPLIGGLKGAKERNFPDWGTTLGTVYKQGMDWLNENAEHGANVALVKGLLSNVPRIKIRSDINFFNEYYSGKKKRGEYLMEVVDYRWTVDIPKDKREYIETLMSVYEVKVDTVQILRVWKNDQQHSKTTD